MPPAEETYRFIRREAPAFAQRLRAAASSSYNEAELRTHVAQEIQLLADQLGVPLHLCEEFIAQVAQNMLALGKMPAVGFSGNLPEGKECNERVLRELRQKVKSQMRHY
jgi:hypothetical protein